MSNHQRTIAVRSATIGAGVLLACASVARSRDVSDPERRVFEQLNAGIGRAEGTVWAVMQFGNGLTAVIAPSALLALGRPRSEALRVGAAAFGGWQLAKGVKRLIPRGRPDALLTDVVLRDGHPTGGGFVSGHATVAVATAVALGASFGRTVNVLIAGSALVVALARVHVGAHLPLDVVGGAGLGLLWGSACTAVPLPSRFGGNS